MDSQEPQRKWICWCNWNNIWFCCCFRSFQLLSEFKLSCASNHSATHFRIIQNIYREASATARLSSVVLFADYSHILNVSRESQGDAHRAAALAPTRFRKTRETPSNLLSFRNRSCTQHLHGRRAGCAAQCGPASLFQCRPWKVRPGRCAKMFLPSNTTVFHAGISTFKASAPRIGIGFTQYVFNLWKSLLPSIYYIRNIHVLSFSISRETSTFLKDNKHISYCEYWEIESSHATLSS